MSSHVKNKDIEENSKGRVNISHKGKFGDGNIHPNSLLGRATPAERALIRKKQKEYESDIRRRDLGER
jgi:hypothetical protein